MTGLAVIALGGNAFTAEGQQGADEELRANAAVLAESVCAILDAGWRLVLVHGNGPQVGNLSIQQEEGRNAVPAQPLSTLGAMTQGQLGSLIALSIRRASAGRYPVSTLVTHAIVDVNDPAFATPTKPIGPFFSKAEATTLAAERGWRVVEDAGRGYRRVVASPQPRGFLELAAISTLLDAGHVVVAAGGGGIPVAGSPLSWHPVDAVIDYDTVDAVIDYDTVDAVIDYDTVDAVIDKDYAAAILGRSLAAEALVLITGVDAVMIDFGTPKQRRLARVDAAEIRRYLADGQFPPGSMGPKVDAATRFLAGGGNRAIITSAALAAATLSGGEPDDQLGTDIIAERVVVPS